MKRFLSIALLSALVLGASSAVYANVCAFDPVPAATLLFPFVVYDYNGGTQGDTTIFAITNVSSESQIVHVTLWTDFSVAILDFNVVLSGYDVQQINIRDILANGDLPITGTYDGTGAVQSVDYEDGPVPPADGPVSPGNTAGSFGNHLSTVPPSLPDAETTACLDNNSALSGCEATDNGRCSPSNPAYPGLYEGGIPSSILALFQDWLQSSQTALRLHLACTTGDTYFLGDTFDSRTTADPTWMYVTADVVWTCNQLFHDELGYFTPAPVGQAMYDNVLIGDMAWVNALNRFSEMDNAVHLEADQQLGAVATDDFYGLGGEPISFYHRYSIVQNDETNDYREPLPTAWAFRFVGAEPGDGLTTYIRAFKSVTWGTDNFDGDFNFLGWDPYPVDMYFEDDFGAQNESPTLMIAFDCLPYTYYSWDEEEDVITTTTNPWSQPGLGLIKPNLLPLETQEVPIEEFNTVDDFGWMLFVWPDSNLLDFGYFYQTWMGVKYVFNDYSAFAPGAVLANYNCFSDQVLPNLGVNYDYVNTFGYTFSPLAPANAHFAN